MLLTMNKAFIVKNLRGIEIGEIVFSESKFEVDIAEEKDKDKIQKLLTSFFEKGIYDLGEVVLSDPIKLGDPLFFDEIQNQLARIGYATKSRKD
jgi:hypothetical protein